MKLLRESSGLICGLAVQSIAAKAYSPPNTKKRENLSDYSITLLGLIMGTVFEIS